MSENTRSLFKMVLNKILSGRWFMTVAITSTYCFIVSYATVKYAGSIVSEPAKMEAFAVGIVMGFSGTAAVVIKSYFDKNDRKLKPEEVKS